MGAVEMVLVAFLGFNIAIAAAGVAFFGKRGGA